MQSAMIIDALRQAAVPLSAVLPPVSWLPHRLVRLPDGRLDKPPCENATSNNPASWFTLDNALDLLASRNHVAGVAFAITKGIISLDYDHCRDPITGELTPQIQQELERFNSYAYVTPSGSGIRIVGINNPEHPIPGGKRVRYLPDKSKVEIFVGPTNHYNTFTHDLIDGYTTLRDISDDTLDYLEGLQGSQYDKSTEAPKSNPEHTRCIEAVRAALKVIPNEARDWDYWSRIGMAAWRSTNASDEGLEAWQQWSAKHPLHNASACEERWNHWLKSPPTKIGFGTLYHLARQANPFFVPPNDPSPDEPTPEPEHTPKRRPAILHLEEIEALPPPEYLIDGLFPEQGLIIPYGPPKGGKTFVVLSACLHIAGDRPWFGRKVRSGGVIYIAGEGLGGLPLRIRTMRAHYQIPSNIPFWVIPRALNFTLPTTAEYLTKLVRDTAGDEPIAVVVVDTLARAMPGADENSAKEVGIAIAVCDQVREELSCAVVPIHHQGKDSARGLRGTSAIHGAVDASFRITKSGSRVTMKNEDQKDAETAPDLVFDMVEVASGIGRSSLVPVLQDNPGPDSGTLGGHSALPSMSRLLIECVTNLVAGGHGAIVPEIGGNVPPNAHGVHVNELRAAFYEKLPTHGYDARKRAFSRAITTLRELKIIGVKEPWIWLA